MRWTEATAEPTERQLRQFVVILSGLLMAWSIREMLLNRDVIGAVDVSVIAMLLALVGWVRPRLFRLMYLAWMIAVFPIAWFVSTLILGMLFIGFVIPISLWFRVVGRDTFGRRPDPDAQTYWIEKPQPRKPSDYLRQF